MSDLIDCLAAPGGYWVVVDDLGDVYDVILPSGRRDRRRPGRSPELAAVPRAALAPAQQEALARLEAEDDAAAAREGELRSLFDDGAAYLRHNLRLVRDEVRDPQGRYGARPDDPFLDAVIRERLFTFEQLRQSPLLFPTTDFWLDLLARELSRSFDAWLRDE